MPAQDRLTEYNIYWVPSVYFDGGFELVIGGGSSSKADYIDALDLCGARGVADVDADLDVKWLGNAAMEIEVAVTNWEATAYVGHVRVYVSELVSTLGWNDQTSGDPYTHAFLDFAVNEPVNIPGSACWRKRVTFDGTQHNSGMGQGYDGIEYDNIMVTAAVFDDVMHQGYSDPPTGAPFDAFYVDDATGARPDTLTVDRSTIPASTGAAVDFTLYGRGENAGRSYLLLGSASGTVPGTPLPGGLVTLPLNRDSVMNTMLWFINAPIFADCLGTLAADGTASATLNVPPLPPGASGQALSFAYALVYPWDFASNAVTLLIVP